MMKRILLSLVLLMAAFCSVSAQERRPVDSKHPMWLVHVDVWNQADPQKIINLIPDDIKPFVVMNLSLSCAYNKEQGIYERPNSAIRTYKSWATICQQNGMWFTCQPASGGHTHIKDDDLETFEYFFTHYPNFLGWNYAEQFWGFDEAGDPSSSSQANRIALFAKLVPMHHKYGGFLTISFCGNIWSHPLNPNGMMKRNAELRKACEQYPEAILWLYKYTTSSCFYNNESVCFGPFVSGLAKNYGVRYDNCGWNGAMSSFFGDNNGRKYPVAAGIGTVMEQTCVNGGAVWDGPELIWTEDFQNLSNVTNSSGYQQRRWGTFPGFDNAWIDMFRRVIDGTLYVPSREEVVEKTKIIIVNNVTSGNDEDKYAAWGDLYDNLYKVKDPMNRGNGQWMDNFSYMKSSGRYGAIPITPELYDAAAKAIPLQVKKATRTSTWSTLTKKKQDFDKYYPQVSKGDLYVNRYRNQLITYNPYSYLSKTARRAKADIPLQYNTCESLHLDYYELSSGSVREYADHIDFYLNNYRTDTTTVRLDTIRVSGVKAEPTTSFKKQGKSSSSPAPQASLTKQYDAEAKTFTAIVKHNGPCTLTINCEGEATDRLTDYLPAEALTDLPVQPQPYNGPITVEAEDMDFKSISNHVTFYMAGWSHVRNHAGNGFVVMGTNTGGSLQHVVNVPKAGDYYVSLRYTNSGSKTGTIQMKVGSKAQNVDVKKTGTNEWLRTGAVFSLNAGKNVFTLTNNKGINLTADQVTYRPVDVEEEKYAITIRESENGVVVPSVQAAAEGEEVKLEVIPNEGYKLSGWRIVHGNLTITNDNTFVMPDEFVTIEPVFADESLVYGISLATAVNGGIPEGWRSVQENNDVHEYPNTYGSGSRVMKGFGGYQNAAIYWREGVCEYGRQSGYPLTLQPGHYNLVFAMAAWKGSPYYKVDILDSKDNAIASGDNLTTTNKILASPNANGNTSANLKSAKLRTLSFEVEKAGKYVIRFSNHTDGDGLQEFLLLECQVKYDYQADGITEVAHDKAEQHAAKVQPGVYSTMGVKMGRMQRGINIVRTSDGRTVKVIR